MMKSKMWMIGFVCALVFAPAIASAQKTPDEWYKEGETQYNLGNFEKAIEAFKQGFSLETTDSKKSAYLYNIAQSYRQAKDCSNAQFFYKRFLALRDADASKPLKADTRREVEERIKELEECARNQEAIKNRPPDKTFKPDDQDTGTTRTPIKTKPDDVAIKTKPDDGNDDDDNRVTKTTPAAGPRVISVRLIGGGAKIRVGEPLDVPVQATFALIAGYPIALGNMTVEIGAAGTFTPVPFEDGMGQSKSAKMIGLVGNVGATYHVAPKVGVRADLGLGVLFFGGVSESPFTDNRVIDGGALSMFHVRVGVSADYAITPNIVATIAPLTFSYSPPKKGLLNDIKSITALDFMVGLGYRM
jgi:hypothetical protein